MLAALRATPAGSANEDAPVLAQVEIPALQYNMLSAVEFAIKDNVPVELKTMPKGAERAEPEGVDLLQLERINPLTSHLVISVSIEFVI